MVVATYTFKCPKCSIPVEYDMSMGNSAKMKDAQICRCPECKTVITYNDIDLTLRKKGKPQKCLFTYLSAKNVEKTQK